MSAEDKVIFKSGAASTKIPRLDLVPREALNRLADRFELGLEKYGERSRVPSPSQACLEDKEWLIARLAHSIDHALKMIGKLRGQLPEDGDAAAIAWGGVCLCEARAKRTNPKPETKP